MRVEAWRYPEGGFMGPQDDAKAFYGYQIYTTRTKMSQ